VAIVPVDECSSGDKCRLSSGCSNVLVVKDAPLVVNGNSTALVGVAAYVEAQCTCNTLIFDRCTSGSCLNGGTCQQLDHSFTSVISTLFPQCNQITVLYIIESKKKTIPDIAIL